MKLKKAGCKTIHAAGDADVTIALSAISVAGSRDTIVIADDTDVLILLCHHGNNTQGRNEGPRKARSGVYRLLALSSVQTFADISHFFTRCWGVTSLHICFFIAKAVQILKKAVQLYQHAEVFYQPTSLKQEIRQNFPLLCFLPGASQGKSYTRKKKSITFCSGKLKQFNTKWKPVLFL